MCVEFNPPVLVLFKVLCVFTSALVQYIVYYFACALNTYARVSEHECVIVDLPHLYSFAYRASVNVLYTGFIMTVIVADH